MYHLTDQQYQEMLARAEQIKADFRTNYVQRIQLLWMPDSESLSAFDKDATEVFGHPSEWDGDAWLAPASKFLMPDLDTGMNAGGKLIWGYEFYYPTAVELPWELRENNWRASEKLRTGYAVRWNTAVYVCSASVVCAGE